GRLDERQGLQPTHLRHREVKYHHIRAQARSQVHGLAPGCGFTDDLEPTVRLDDDPKQVADVLDIIRKHHAHRLHSAAPLSPRPRYDLTAAVDRARAPFRLAGCGLWRPSIHSPLWVNIRLARSIGSSRQWPT